MSPFALAGATTCCQPVALHLSPAQLERSCRRRGQGPSQLTPSRAWQRRGGAVSAPLTASAVRSDEGSFYESAVVQQESASIMNEYEAMMKLLPKFAGFDLDGKRIFLEKMDGLCERLKIFNFRAKSSDDPAVKQFLSNLGRQLLYMNTNLDSIYAGMLQQSEELRRLVEAESKIADKDQLRAFRVGLARDMSIASAAQDALARNLSMEKMMDDPKMMKTIMSNPKALVAIRDVTERGPAAAEMYKDDADLYRALCKIFELP